MAGGISPDNVFDGIMHIRPAGIDSCTGTNVFDEKGQPTKFTKDTEKVKLLIQEVHRAEEALGLL